MIEVHLIGYTADLRHVVLDVDADDTRGRYRLRVDGDLFATLDDLRQQRWDQGLDVGGWDPSDLDADDVEDEDEDEDEDESALSEDELSDEELFEDELSDEELFEDELSDEELFEDDLVVDLTEASGAQALGQSDDSPEEALEEFSVQEPSDPEIRPFAPADEDAEVEDLDDVETPAAATSLPAVVIVPAPPAPPVSAVAEPSPDEDLAEMLDEWAEASDQEGVDAHDGGDEGDEGHEPEEASGRPVIASLPPGPADGDVAPYPPIRPQLDSDVPARTALPATSRRRIDPDVLEVPHDAAMTPAQIQAELRAGTSLRAVAQKARVPEAWVQRWLDPIEAERARIIEQAHAMPVLRDDRPSAAPLGRATEMQLRRRGVDASRVSWDAARRADGTWRITCRFTEKGRARTASWLLPRGETSLRPASDLARQIGWVDRRSTRSTAR